MVLDSRRIVYVPPFSFQELEGGVYGGRHQAFKQKEGGAGGGRLLSHIKKQQIGRRFGSDG